MPGLRSPRASVLVVEDDLALARTLIDALETADYRVWHAANGQEARTYAEHAWPDLVLLDLLLPDVDGLVLCSLLKSVTDVPIIMCGASARRSDAVLALKLGADDFVRKPFDMDTLLARIEAVLRRRPPVRAPVSRSEPRRDELRVGDLLIEPQRRRATLAGAMLALTPTEFRLLTALTAHAGSALTRDRLAHDVWGYADASNGRTIDVHIRRLRVKLGHARVLGPSIVAVRGTGYRITADERSISAA